MTCVALDETERTLFLERWFKKFRFNPPYYQIRYVAKYYYPMGFGNFKRCEAVYWAGPSPNDFKAVKERLMKEWPAATLINISCQS